MKRFLCLLLALLCCPAPAAQQYRLDASHTRVAFDVRRFGIAWISAHFSEISGDFVVDREGGGSRVDVTVRTNSIECPDPEWNEQLRSGDWLDTQEFPEMTYRSTRIEFIGEGRAVAQGVLTLHGVSRPVQLDVSRLQCRNEPRPLCEFAATAQVKRSEFGLPHGFWQAGDRVEISISGTGQP